MFRRKIDLEALDDEDIYDLFEGITDEQAENSDVGGDSEAEDGLPQETLVSSVVSESVPVQPVFDVPETAGRPLFPEPELPASATAAETLHLQENRPSSPVNAFSLPARSTAPRSATRGQVRTRGGLSRQTSAAENPYKFRRVFRQPHEYRQTKFSQYSGIRAEVDLLSPLQIFLTFFTNDILEHITNESNWYSKNNLEMTVLELKAFLGMLIIMGFHTLPSMRLYWSKNSNFFVARIAKVMSVKRFLKVLRFLHLNDNSTMRPRNHPDYDRLHKVRPLINMLGRKFEDNFSPSRYLSVDESMIPFKGRSMLKQYMPLKPVKRGFKVWVVCCAVTGYMCAMDVYEGRKENNEYPDVGLGEQVVLKLCDAFVGFGYCIFFDRFFSSLVLLTRLLAKKLFACGTLMANRKHYPKDKLKEDSELGTGDFDSVMDGSISVTKWKDRGKKCVIMASNMHNPADLTTVSRTNKEGRKEDITCPKSIADYNKYMGGVDKFDQLLATYTVSWKSRRWWLKIFYYLLDASIVNSYIVYKETAKKMMKPKDILSHLEFRSKLADELIDNFCSRQRDAFCDEPWSSKPVDHFPIKSKYRRCAYCSTRARQVRSRIACDVCNVCLCLQCFKPYHLNDCKKKGQV